MTGVAFCRNEHAERVTRGVESMTTSKLVSYYRMNKVKRGVSGLGLEAHQEAV
jgi:hypothetical protein